MDGYGTHMAAARRARLQRFRRRNSMGDHLVKRPAYGPQPLQTVITGDKECGNAGL